MEKFLTNQKIEALEPRETVYCVADGGGLRLLVHPSGVKSWQSRMFVRHQDVRISLGTWPA